MIEGKGLKAEVLAAGCTQLEQKEEQVIVRQFPDGGASLAEGAVVRVTLTGCSSGSPNPRGRNGSGPLNV